MSDNNTKDSNSHTYVPYKHKLDTLTTLQRTPYVGLSARETVQYNRNEEGDPIDANGQKVTDIEAARISQRDANTHFESKSQVKIIDLISEGPIEGFCSQNGETISYFGKSDAGRGEVLQSVYFDGTKVLNPDLGTLNYRLANVDLRPGYGGQLPLPADYQFASQTIPINARLTPAAFYQTDGKIIKDILVPRNDTDGKEFLSDWKGIESIQDVSKQFLEYEKALEPIVHTIQNPLVEEVTVNIKIHVLSKLHVGKRSSEVVGSECSFLIYIGNESGNFDPRFPVLCEGNPKDVSRSGHPTGRPYVRNQTGGYFVRVARGLATSDYIFETRFHLPPNFKSQNRIIKVFRLERDKGYEAKDPQVECSFESVVESIPFKLRYPYSALIGTTIDSTAIARIPKREYDLKLLKVKVPSNYVPDTKQYFGNWSGRFKEYVAVIDESVTKDLKVVRPQATVTNRAKSDGTKQIKVSTSVKKYGSGSILFPSASGLTLKQDWAKRISIHNDSYKFPIEKDDGPKKELRVSDFGFQNFTIEFYIKVQASDLGAVYYSTDGSNRTSSSGIEGFYKTIISSSEGQIPCGGTNESDNNRNDSELYEHPSVRKFLNYSAGIAEQGSLPVAGNWMVEIGTANGKDQGQIFFRYFTYGAYYRPIASNTSVASQDYERVPVLDTGGRPTVAAQVVLKSTTNVADNAWHHVAITRQGNNFNVWVDGTDRTDSTSTKTYDGDVRGFVYKSGTQKDTGLIEIGNDRTNRLDSVGDTVISSFEGYLDYIHIIRKCKYTASGFNTSPEQVSDLIPNEQQTVALISADGQPNNGTTIRDYNPVLVLPKEATNFIENFGSAFLQWTDNPAWIFYDLVTNNRYGLGKYGINKDFVNKWNMYELGKYCDELVKTGWQSKYKQRNFQVVTPSDTENDSWSDTGTGEVYIKINGFETQEEFLREYPRFSTIAIFDLDDGKRPVKRVIEYVKIDDNTKSADQGNKYHSWLGAADEKGLYTQPGSAVIKLLRPLSLDECFLLNPDLKIHIINEQYKENSDGKSTRNSNTSPKKIIYRRYGDYEKLKKQSSSDSTTSFVELPGDNSVLSFFFDGQKINSTSASGKAAVEFKDAREILEPRFTANLYLTTAVDAFKVLNDLSSVFLGLTYIVGGKVFASFDKARDPIMNFTNSNVKDGSFTYTGSAKTSRFTTALVRYVDKYENFKPKVEYVEDSGGIIKYGLIEKELIAFGCTSRGQARRLGKWFLFSAQLETDSVQFSAGKEASYLRPGDVVKIIDKNKTRKRYGGRIVRVSNSRREITLDAEVGEEVVGQIITVAIPSSFETEQTLDQNAQKRGGISEGDLSALRKPQIKEFKISSVNTDRTVPNQKTIVTLKEINDSDAEKVGIIKPGAIWILQNKDAELKIQEVLYRVMNIEEENAMEYKVSCLEYNKTKFKASEDDADSDKTNVSAIGIGGSGKLEKQIQAAAGDDSIGNIKKYMVTNVQGTYDPEHRGPRGVQFGQKLAGPRVFITWGLPALPASQAGSELSFYKVSFTISGNQWDDSVEPIQHEFKVSALDKNGQDITSFSFNPYAEITDQQNRQLGSNQNKGRILFDVKVVSLVGVNEVAAEPVLGGFHWSEKDKAGE
jgi:hypothetical protein